ncbi:MFS transporter [Beijerinckia indica]|uniref:Major facilitator superfamily MFS_1 n=1 Tax=Beijerinckia indica subsp. indica (strain ATCC 9039 / DSM 1715 / NCIMB 8712) TaxID=395963 RepID=B2ICR2_BEII9|nr:MFS transporter [Beijerinckia indica]ACB95336.1 major facilitator superfamily MFS_1 [Beijerinckia indica subsp. indica ATCC 9039]
MPLALFALALASFGIGTSEFVIMGILPEIARDLTVTIPQAGLLVTAYALTVTFAGPVVALLAARLPQKTALLGLLCLFLLGNLFCALAPQFSLLLIARIFTALAHAAFYGNGVVVAASLVPPHRRSQAIALMFSGMTLANIIGVPVGTMIGLAQGWRATFWAIIPFLGVAGIALAILLPRKGQERAAGRLVDELIVLRRPQVLLTLLASVFIAASLFCVLTYISPLLATVTGMDETQISSALLLFGGGTFFGIFVGGRLADWRQMTTIVGTFVVLGALYAVFAFSATSIPSTYLTIFLLGFVSFANGPGMQARVIDKASEAPNIGASLIHSSYNFGNGAGAWLGGAALASGMSYGHLPWLSVGLVVAALATLGIAHELERNAENAGGLDPEALS